MILLKEPSTEKALLTLHVMTEMHFLLPKKTLKIYHAWSCQNVSEAFLLDNNCIQFGTKLYRQVVSGIPMGTNCAPLVADLFLFFL